MIKRLLAVGHGIEMVVATMLGSAILLMTTLVIANTFELTWLDYEWITENMFLVLYGLSILMAGIIRYIQVMEEPREL